MQNGLDRLDLSSTDGIGDIGGGSDVGRAGGADGESDVISAFSRTCMVIGHSAMRRLEGSRVAIFGLGGVGGYALEGLARSGIGALDLIDSDRIAPSNLNRQILATQDSIGRYKADAAKERVLSINPKCDVRTHIEFFLPDKTTSLDFKQWDFVIDALDTVTAKLHLIACAKKAGVGLISCMGTGDKLDPSMLEAADISKTHDCPFARIIRKELRRRGISHVRVVYSPERPKRACGTDEAPNPGRRSIPGSAVFVPAAAGMLMASEAVRYLSEGQDPRPKR